LWRPRIVVDTFCTLTIGWSLLLVTLMSSSMLVYRRGSTVEKTRLTSLRMGLS